MLFLGFLLTLAFIAPELAGTWDTAVATSCPPEFFRLEGGKGWSFLVTTFLAFLLATFAPGYATRYCIGGRDLRHTGARHRGGSVPGAGVPADAFHCRVRPGAFPGHRPATGAADGDPRSAQPGAVGDHDRRAALPVGDVLGGFGAELGHRDFRQGPVRAPAGLDGAERGPAAQLARLCTALLGLAAVSIAILRQDIIGLLLFTYHIWAPAIILPVVVGTLTTTRSPATRPATSPGPWWFPWCSTFGYRFSPLSLQVDPAVFGVLLSILVYSPPPGPRSPVEPTRQPAGSPTRS